jgi:hypothetical protein
MTKYGLLSSDLVAPGGLTGATAASRYVGATTSGAPLSAPAGGFFVGDYIVDQSGSFWICTTAGSPGTWTQVAAGGGGGGAVTSVFGRTGVVVAQSGDYTAAQVGAAAALVPTAVKTTAYTAVGNDFVPVDTTSGAITITLPTAPTDKTTIGVKLVKQAGTNAVTVQTGGSDTFNDDSTTTAALKLLNQGGTWQYSSSAAVWYRLSVDLPLTQLDTRYPVLSGASLTVPVAPEVFTLTDATTIAVDASKGNHFRVTLGGNRTLGAPTNPTDGQKVVFEVIQDATGSRTLAFNAAYAFSTAIPTPTLTTTPNKRDFIGFTYNSTTTLWYCLAFVNGF